MPWRPGGTGVAGRRVVRARVARGGRVRALVVLLGAWGTTASGQEGVRLLAPPVPLTVNALHRQRAEASDMRFVAGALDEALALLVPGGAAERPMALPELKLLGQVVANRPARETVAGWLGDAATGSYETAWRAARVALGLGEMAATADEARRWFVRGTLWGWEAVAHDPDPLGMESRFWLLANLGRWALMDGDPYARGRTSGVVHDLAQSLLRRDPDHAGAHIVLGRMHLEVRSQQPATRALAALVFGREFVRRSTFEAALEHLARGARLAPALLYFQREWAHGLALVGRCPEAIRVWRTMLAMPPRFPIDAALQAQVRAQRLCGGA